MPSAPSPCSFMRRCSPTTGRKSSYSSSTHTRYTSILNQLRNERKGRYPSQDSPQRLPRIQWRQARGGGGSGPPRAWRKFVSRDHSWITICCRMSCIDPFSMNIPTLSAQDNPKLIVRSLISKGFRLRFHSLVVVQCRVLNPQHKYSRDSISAVAHCLIIVRSLILEARVTFSFLCTF